MSGKPAFLFCDYADAASVTATDTLTGTDPENVLFATEDTVWSPANATGAKDIVINVANGSGSFDSTSFLGENLEGVNVLVSTSSDNFATETDYSSTPDVAINGDFATGDLTGWDTTITSNITITADVTGATFTATDTTGVDGALLQSVIEVGKQQLIRYTVSSISAGLTVQAVVTGDTGIVRTTAGTFTEVVGVSSGLLLAFLVVNDGATTVGATVKITDIQVFEYFQLSADNNASFIQHAQATFKQYIKYTIDNPSTSLQIAHICGDILVEQPRLEEDWGSEGVAPVFTNLVSTGGGFLGNNQLRTMRDVNINFGEITDTEYINRVKPWVDSRVKVAKPFYFLPDVDNLDEIYFVWLEDNTGFTAPLRQGIRTVAPIAAKTRIA